MMTEHNKEKRFSGQTKIIVKRTFGDQDALDVYTDYVAQKIKDQQNLKEKEDQQ